MPAPQYQQQFDSLITALTRQEWGKSYLLLIELKSALENNSQIFHHFQILEAHAEFIEQEFSFSEEELKNRDEIIKAIESFLQDQAEDHSL